MKANITFLLTLWLGFVPCFSQKITENQVLASADFDRDGIFDWRADIHVSHDGVGTLDESYSVVQAFRVGQTSRPLRATAAKIDFSPGELITQASPLYTPVTLFLIAYGWLPWDPFSDSPVDYAGEFRYQISAIIGAKYTDPETGEVTLGWFRFSRPSLEPGTAFTLESWAYHPIPNEPIRAGEPPDLPEPAFAWGDEGVTVSWPEKAWMLRLEMAPSLTPPVSWQPVDTGGLTSVTLPPTEGAEQYFRLVAPEL